MSEDGSGNKKADKEEIDLPLSTSWKPSFAQERKTEAQPLEDLNHQKPVSKPAVVSEPKTEQAVIKEASKPTKQCPKCCHINENFFSCDRCGLVFAEWTYGSKKRVEQQISEEVTSRAAKVWREFERHPQNEELLESFHNYCVKNEAIKIASDRYREKLLKNPDHELLLKYRQKIVSKVMAEFPLVSTKKEKKNVSLKTIIIGILITVLLSAAGAIMLIDFLENS